MPALVCLGERVRDLRTVSQHLVHRQWSRPNPRRQRFALDQLHHEVVGPDIVERADVRVIECCDGTCLAVETLAKARCADLDGDRTIEAGIDRPEHLPHTAGTKPRLHTIDTELPAGLQHRRRCRGGRVVRLHVADILMTSVSC
jgi:hypothetical protein